MKTLKIIAAIVIPFVLISSKCKQTKTEGFVQEAKVQTTNGGVYGSGSTTNYSVLFSNEVKDTLIFDSILIDAGNNKVYKRVANQNGWGLRKVKNGQFYFDIRFLSGERVQADGTIEFVEIPTYSKPEIMGENQAVIFGRYGKKEALIQIEKFELIETVNMP